MTQKKILLEVKELSKSYSKTQIFKNISFELEKEEILGILGYSGEGKSTLLNILCGLENFEGGSIVYHLNSKEEKITNLSENQLKEKIGYSTQEPSFYEEMTTYENLAFFAEMLGVDKSHQDMRIYEILKLLQLERVKDHLGSELSVGMKKRLDVGCSLIHNPKILILDEPTANLDFNLRDEFIKYIKQINKMGITIIYVSHFIDEIETISKKVLLINNGMSKVVRKSSTLKKEFMEFVKETKRKNESNITAC